MENEIKLPERLAIVERAISEMSDVSITKIRGISRAPSYVEARHAIWYIAFDHMGFGYSQIARAYCKDHTTIMHGVKKMRTNPLRGKIVEAVKNRCPGVIIPRPQEEKTSLSEWKL